MQTVIEQVVTSDESARKLVADARREAEALVNKAVKEAEAARRAGHDRLARVEMTEIKPIISEAEQEAEDTLARAGQYIQQLQAAVADGKDRILDEFLALVLDTGKPAA